MRRCLSVCLSLGNTALSKLHAPPKIDQTLRQRPVLRGVGGDAAAAVPGGAGKILDWRAD